MSPLRRSGLLVLALLAVPASPAGAAQGPLTGGYVADGQISALAVDGQGRAYAGGSFDRVGPHYGHSVVLSTSSSTPASGLPDVNGDVYATVSDGSGGWFIGGAFNAVGGVTRNDLAHIKSDLTLDSAWNPGANNVVRALALSGSAVYAGGDFTQVGGASHFRLAKLDAGTGAVDAAWLASSGGSVHALAVVGSFLYVGGNGSVGGGAPPNLGRVAAAGIGAPDATFVPLANGTVEALAATGTTLYAGGGFLDAGSGPATHLGLAKIDTTITGADPVDNTWDPQLDPIGPPRTGALALALAGPDLIVGGSFGTVDGTTRLSIAKLSATGTGLLDAAWHPNTDFEVDALAVSGDDVVVGGTYFSLGPQTHGSLGKVSLSSGTASATWNPNPGATVDALAFSGSSLLAGGTFASAGPLNVLRGGLARLNADGTLDTGWTMNTVGAVNALLLSGSDLYLGGDFSFVGGALHPLLARVNTATQTVDTGWTPQFGGSAVNALALSGTSLYVGGSFSLVAPDLRDNLAKLNTVGTPLLDPDWNPRAAGVVNALVVSGSSVFAGGGFGGFLSVGGGGPPRLGKIDAATGTVDTTWAPAPSNTVQALAVSGSDLFAGGFFTTIGGQGRSRIAKLSTTGTGDADTTWNPGATVGVLALTLDGDQLYAGGAFTTIGGQARSGLARLATTGTGAPDSRLVPPASNGVVTAIAPAPSRLFVGGSFTALGGLSLSGLGLYDLTAPSIAVTVPVEGGRYAQGATVPAAYSCSDPDGAGNIASCAGPVASGAGFDTAAAGPKTFTATATDAGGDTASQSVSYVVDASAPRVTITTPAAGVTFTKGQVVSVDYSCTDIDGASDLASCQGPVASGAALDTASAGIHNFTVTATDVAGNASDRTATYVVLDTTTPATDTTKPAIAGLFVKPSRFRAAKGARVSYTLSENATVAMAVQLLRKGKKPKGLGSFSVKGKAGANHFTFRGRVGGKTLKPGSYRLSARATDAAHNRSAAALAAFRIVKK